MALAWYNHLLCHGLGAVFGVLLALGIPCRSMKFIWHASPGHARSLGMHVIDPAGNPTQEESYILRIPLRQLRSGMRDEEILARFSNGFFAGFVFAPERWIAPFVQGIIDHEVFTNARVLGHHDSSRHLDVCKIDRPDAMPRLSLPPLGACLFGLYYLIDTSACSAEDRISTFPSSAAILRPDCSFVEFAGRTSGRSLAASHRFEVSRDDEPWANGCATTTGEKHVTIVYSHVRSNPRTGGQVYSRLMTAMHVCYAHLLFANGVREVLRPG
ncbi:hypothetical protein BJY01DRAFT_223217 [Aspergillus pseudoustus]|uniref:Uncharacterized protein n=1 Tax=Aspergillus pseudoustus TaxID=1810923 RepID=A0ABR4J7X0_9EURO